MNQADYERFQDEMKCCESCRNDYTIDPTAMANGTYCLNYSCECHRVKPKRNRDLPADACGGDGTYIYDSPAPVDRYAVVRESFKRKYRTLCETWCHPDWRDAMIKHGTILILAAIDEAEGGAKAEYDAKIEAVATKATVKGMEHVLSRVIQLMQYADEAIVNAKEDDNLKWHSGYAVACRKIMEFINLEADSILIKNREKR